MFLNIMALIVTVVTFAAIIRRAEVRLALLTGGLVITVLSWNLPTFSDAFTKSIPEPEPGPATPEPSATPLATLVFPTPLPPPMEPSATPQLSLALSSAVIQILSPGPMSKVLSPVRLHAYVIPGYNSKVRVELYGEDGRLMYRKILPVYTDIFKWAYLSLDISFTTRAAAELARLQVSTEDANGNVIALSAVHLLLMSDGYEEITPAGILNERCVFYAPVPSATVRRRGRARDARRRSRSCA